MVYVALTEIASNLQTEQFIVRQEQIAKLSGLSIRTVFVRLNDLQCLKLLTVTTPKMKAASTYTLLRSATNSERSETIAERSATIAHDDRQPLPTLEESEEEKNIMNIHKHPSRDPELFHRMKARINAIYQRESDFRWDCCEESLLSEITTRPKAEAELEEIEAFKEKAPQFMPGDVTKLLVGWTSTLDHAKRPIQTRNGYQAQKTDHRAEKRAREYDQIIKPKLL